MLLVHACKHYIEILLPMASITANIQIIENTILNSTIENDEHEYNYSQCACAPQVYSKTPPPHPLSFKGTILTSVIPLIPISILVINISDSDVRSDV